MRSNGRSRDVCQIAGRKVERKVRKEKKKEGGKEGKEGEMKE